jgi:putative tryptophan/tyrosine transport system substrate-binding protein
MRRREFLGILGGVAGLPLVARAQQASRVRRIGVNMSAPKATREPRPATQYFEQDCKNSGGRISGGRMVPVFKVDYRWLDRQAPELLRTYAAELVNLEPDVILA